jgi:hypothetical protein
MRLSFGIAGWVAVDGLGLPGPLYVRVRPEVNGGRLRIVELYLDASLNEQSPITSSDIRELPVTRIEAMINARPEPANLRIRSVGPDLSTLASYYSTDFWNEAQQIEERNWVVLNYMCQLNPDQLKGLPPFRHVQRMNRRNWRRFRDVDVGFRLATGPQDGLTDAFLGDVARAYASAVARGERPNKAIAEQTGYPLKTVQRWVYTARQRGIMPRGSKGRPG